MDTRHLDADVLIVGGGPAGSAAAISCATRGLRVVLVERQVFAGERPGDTLHPGIEPLLRQLGIAEMSTGTVGARHPGIWIDWAGAPRFEAFGQDADGPWLGFQVQRSAFDAMLVDRAGTCGAEIRQPCRVIGIARDPAGLWDVTMSSGGRARPDATLRCRIVMDATGTARWLSRKLGLAVDDRSVPLAARWGYVRGKCPVRDEAPRLTGDGAGWTWSARVGVGLYGWVRLQFGAGGRPDALDAPAELGGLSATGPARGADVTWRLARRPAEPGWFILGDAAAQLDPISSHGVLKAIMSGMMAAHLAAGVIGTGVPAQTAADHYADWLRGWFEADADRLSAFYRQLGIDIRPPSAGILQTPVFDERCTNSVADKS